MHYIIYTIPIILAYIIGAVHKVGLRQAHGGWEVSAKCDNVTQESFP